jgi:outer membrane biosynthesis protein TonB
MSMRRMQRIVLLATFVAVVPVLSGCANFDPESLDIFGFGEKKKLPGDRRPVFPEGVPGVTQGVPTQYIKGNQPTADAVQGADQVAPPAAAPVEESKPEPKPKPAVKPKPKRKVAAKPKPKPAAPVQPVSQEQQPAQQPQGQQAQAPSAWPQGSTPPSGGATAWPAPPPTGTFSR